VSSTAAVYCKPATSNSFHSIMPILHELHNTYTILCTAQEAASLRNDDLEVTSLAFTAAAASAVESARIEEVTRLSEFHRLLTELAAAESAAAQQLAQQQAQSLPLIHAVHSSSNDVEQLVVGTTATATAGASTPAGARHRGGSSRGLSQVMFMKFHSDLLQREREGSVSGSGGSGSVNTEQFPVPMVVPRHAPCQSGASLSDVNEESAADVRAAGSDSGAAIDTETAATPPPAAVVATVRAVSLGELGATAASTGSSADAAAGTGSGGGAVTAGDLQQRQQQQQQHTLTLTRCASEPRAVGVSGLLQQQSDAPVNGESAVDTGTSDSRRNSSSIRRLRSASSSGSLGSTVHDAAAAAQLERPSPRTLIVSVNSL
jgi:hypothetical protein